MIGNEQVYLLYEKNALLILCVFIFNLFVNITAIKQTMKMRIA